MYFKKYVISFFLLTLVFSLSAEDYRMSSLSGIRAIEHTNYGAPEPFPSYTNFSSLEGGKWLQSIRSKDYIINITFTDNFEMLSSYTQYLDEESVQGSGLKEIWFDKMEGNRYRIRSINKKDKEKIQEKNMPPVLDHSMLYYMIQAKMIQDSHANELRFRVFNPYILRDYELIYEKKEWTKEQILENSSKYNFPSEMLELLEESDSYVFWEGRIAGLVSALYPHRFHVLFNPDDQYKIILEWGGDPKSPFYSIPHYL